MASPEEKKFVHKCIELGSRTDAFVAVWGNKKNRHTETSCAYEVFHRPAVVKYYNKVIKKMEDADIADAKECMRLLSRMARRDATETVVSRGETVEIPVRPADAIRAAEILLKKHGAAGGIDEHEYGIIMMPEIADDDYT